MNVSVIIAAAGFGKRMGEKECKQFIKIKNKPILLYTIEVFQKCETINEIIVVTNSEIINSVKKLIEKSKITKITTVTLGGKERQDSVYEGLKSIEPEINKIVLIHDAVRPFICEETINNIIINAKKYGAAVPGVPVKDTLKFMKKDTFIRTLDRDRIWVIQTPQGFKYSLIMKAYEKALKDNFKGTDDASLVERIGRTPRAVLGSYYNIKITTPEDLKIAKLLLSNF